MKNLGWNRLERWFAVQLMLPRAREEEPVPPLPYFEACYLDFLGDLPELEAMSTAEFAKLAFFAGAAQAFRGLAQHDKDVQKMRLSDEESQLALTELALEPMEYLRARGIRLP